MNKLGRVAVLSVAVLAILTAACSGNDSKPKAKPQTQRQPLVSEALITQWFNETDTNHDGKIDDAERTAVIKSDFTAMDVNRDDKVTIEDIVVDVDKQTPRKPVTGDLASYLPMDTDKNGTITLDEYTTYVTTRFAGIDGNHDGASTLAEGKAFYTPKGGLKPRSSGSTTSTSKGMAALPVPVGVFLVLGVPFLLIGRRRITQRLGAVGIGAVIALVALAAPAGASAVYNTTPWTTTIDFSCGWFCGTSWTIAGGGNNWDAYPGKAGMYYIQNDNSADELYDQCESGGDGQIGVPDHGYSTLNATGSQPKQLAWNDYDNNNQLIKTVQVQLGVCNNVG